MKAEKLLPAAGFACFAAKELGDIFPKLSSVAHDLSVVSLVQVIIIWVLLWCVFSCFVVLRFSVSAVVVLRFTVSAVVVLRFVWCSSLIVVSLWVGAITVYEFFYLAALCNGYSRLVIPYLLQSGGECLCLCLQAEAQHYCQYVG